MTLLCGLNPILLRQDNFHLCDIQHLSLFTKHNCNLTTKQPLIFNATAHPSLTQTFHKTPDIPIDDEMRDAKVSRGQTIQTYCPSQETWPH